MKKMKNALCTVLSFTVAVAALAGCSAQEETPPAPTSATSQSMATESASGASGPITVTDMNDREVVLESSIEKIVALTPSDAEIIYALGAGEYLIGRGEYCDYPEEILDVPVVQSGNETNVEEIISLAPQLVVINTMAQPLENIEQLENAGISVITTTSTDIAGVYESIEIIGMALGLEAEADSLVADMQASFDALVAQIPQQEEAPSVYFEISPLEFGLWRAGNNTFMNEIAVMLGMENSFGDVEGWAEISEEQVLDRDPDVIVTIAMDFGGGQTPSEEILARSGWQQLSAIQNAQVVNLAEDELSRPGPRLVDGAQALFNAVYGAQAENTSSDEISSSTADSSMSVSSDAA